MQSPPDGGEESDNEDVYKRQVKILGHGMLLEPQQGISVTYSRNVLIDGVTVVNPRDVYKRQVPGI